jgi:hypothetical protein
VTKFKILGTKISGISWRRWCFLGQISFWLSPI